MPYTERSRANLLREGFPGERIFVTGNPIFEVLRHYDASIQKSTILSKLGLEKRRYFLVTMHRAENVDIESRLRCLVEGVTDLHRIHGFPVVCSTHPRTRDRLERSGVGVDNDTIRFLPPFGFFDFVHLEQNAFCVLTDSGTVQEECCIFGVPNVTIRDVTERPETIEAGANILSGADPEMITQCVKTALTGSADWRVPVEYLVPGVSTVLTKIVLGYDRGPQRSRA